MISGRFIKSSLMYTIGGALPLASGFILLPFYTNMLDVSQFGVLALYIGISLFTQIIVSYAIDSYVGINYLKAKEEKGKEVELIRKLFTFLIVGGVTFFLLMLFSGKYIFGAIFSDKSGISFFPFGIMTIATAFFNGFFKTATTLLIYRQEPVKYLFFNFVNFALTIAISLYGLYQSPHTLDGPMYGRLFSGVGIFLLSLIFLVRDFNFRLEFGIPKGLHRFCIPYVIYLLMAWVLANIDRFIINSELNSTTVGIYDFGLKCVLLIELMQNGITSAFYPEAFKLWKTDGRNSTTPESNRYFNVFSSLNIVMAAGFFVVIPPLIPLVISKIDYYQSFAFMGVIAASFVTRGLYHYFMAPVVYLQRTDMLPKIFGISAFLQVAGTFLAAKYFDLDGVIWMNISIKIIQIFLLWLFVRKLFNYTMNIVKMVLLPAVFIATMIALWVIHPTQYYFFEALIVFGVFSILIYFVYRNEIGLVAAKFLGRKKAQ